MHPKPARTAKPRKPIKVWATPYDIDQLKNTLTSSIGPSKWYPDDAPFVLFDASAAAHEERVEQVAIALYVHGGTTSLPMRAPVLRYYTRLATAALSALHPKL
jgi:hypothetical protein